jgi:hypothetical protein
LTTRKTNLFQYDELTWDAVADLPRDTPLVLPLGTGYDMDFLADQLGAPEKAGILPAFPFGWRNSGLEVPDQLFWQYIFNLLDSLRDDGFTRVYCLAPQGIDPQSSFLGGIPRPFCASRIRHVMRRSRFFRPMASAARSF